MPQLWNTKDGSMLYTFRGHIAEIVCLSFDPMSTYLVTGSMDKTSILWNVDTGQAVMQIDVTN
jgi:dynein assembly factor with WDR repeat domains 1